MAKIEANKGTTTNKTLTVAIVGATGAVGSLMATELLEMGLTHLEVRLFASKASAGKQLTFAGGNSNDSMERTLTVEELTDESFQGVDIALFAAGATVSRRYAPVAVDAGAVVIDNSSAFRNDNEIPLIVAEVNAKELQSRINTGKTGARVRVDPMIIANPNCVAIISAVAINPLHTAFGVQSIEMTTLQSASGAGRAAMAEVIAQASDFNAVEDLHTMKPQRFAHPLLFNVIPQIGDFHDDGITEEEHKIHLELQKILDPQNPIPCMATCVRVPTLTSHAMSITLQFNHDVNIADIEKVLLNGEGVELLNNHHQGEYPMPIISSGTDTVFVGRLRKNPSEPQKLHMFVAGDQLRKGAATNALQIMQTLIK